MVPEWFGQPIRIGSRIEPGQRLELVFGAMREAEERRAFRVNRRKSVTIGRPVLAHEPLPLAHPDARVVGGPAIADQDG